MTLGVAENCQSNDFPARRTPDVFDVFPHPHYTH